MGNSLGEVSCTFSTIILWSTYEQLFTWICYCYQSKISFNWLFWLFNLLVPPFYFLKRNYLLSTDMPVFNESRHNFKYLLSWEVCTNLLVKLWYIHIQMYGGSEFQSNNIKKHPSHIHYFWICLSRNVPLTRLIIKTLL